MQGFQKVLIYYFTNFLRFTMNFQSSYKIITNQSLRHYSHESLTSQLGPPLFSNLSAKSISFIPRPETEQFTGARDSGRRGDRQRRRRGPGASTCPAAPVGGPNSDEDCRWRADHVSQRRPRQPCRRSLFRPPWFSTVAKGGWTSTKGA